jgi:hypothetical protein
MSQGIDDFAKRMADSGDRVGRRSLLGRLALVFGGVGAGVLASETPSFAATAGTCPPGLKLCGKKCRVITIDPDHCGSCGHTCGSDQVCRGGTCQSLTTTPLCPSGKSWCGACVDLQGDPDNCGSCGHACDDGQTCNSGTCQSAPACTTAADCGTDTECKQFTCGVNGVCGVNFVAENTPIGAQVPGDCKTRVCDGIGGVTQIPDDGDLPDVSGSPCLSAVCAGGVASTPPKQAGTACPDGLCNDSGICVPTP